MILRLILIAILIFLFIRVSQRLLAGIRAVTGTGNRTGHFKNQRRNQSTQKPFDHIEEAEFEDISEPEKDKE